MRASMTSGVQEGPSLQVTHLVQHPWVTPSGRMNFPALEHWSPQRSRLVAVVQEAFSALSGQPLRSPSPHRPGAPACVRQSAARVHCRGAIWRLTQLSRNACQALEVEKRHLTVNPSAWQPAVDAALT